MKNLSSVTLGGGCFWCTEAIFLRIKGIENVTSGYTGGKTLNPTYKDICSGLTGHAEVVKISYDSDVISYADILRIHLTTHDPTTLNRQGADKGTQYRSVIYYSNAEEKEITNNIVLEIGKLYDDPIVTEISEIDTFYPAEVYHSDYYNRNSHTGYCQVVINPKLERLKKLYSKYLKEE